MSYSIAIERGHENYTELEVNYRRHYTEMTERLLSDGFEISPYSPRLDEYFKAFRSGHLLNFVVRNEGQAVGHCNVYVTNDMHNNDKIAVEDMIYILPEHRNGIGRKLVKFVLNNLEDRGVKRVTVSALTDLRVEKIWGRMGFQSLATQMQYTF